MQASHSSKGWHSVDSGIADHSLYFCYAKLCEERMMPALRLITKQSPYTTSGEAKSHGMPESLSSICTVA